MHFLHCAHDKGFWTAAHDWLQLKVPRLHPDTQTKYGGRQDVQGTDHQNQHVPSNTSALKNTSTLLQAHVYVRNGELSPGTTTSLNIIHLRPSSHPSQFGIQML